MDNLIARVATAANTSPETARQAVALIVDFLKREAPDDAISTLMKSAPALNAIAASAPGAGGEGMGNLVKGLMGTGSGAMGGGGLMALGGDLMNLGLGMDQIQAVGKDSVRICAHRRRRRRHGRNFRGDPRALAVHLNREAGLGELASAFPAFGEADWRKAAEAALKGGSLDSLASKTSDGIALGADLCRRLGAARVARRERAVARAGAPRSSRRRRRE